MTNKYHSRTIICENLFEGVTQHLHSRTISVNSALSVVSWVKDDIDITVSIVPSSKEYCEPTYLFYKKDKLICKINQKCNDRRR